jgi:hypothetical protein
MSKIENRRARTAQTSKPGQSPTPQANTPSKTRDANPQRRTVASDKGKSAEPKAKVDEAKRSERKNSNEAHGMMLVTPVGSIASSIGGVTTATGPLLQQSIDGLRNYLMDGGRSETTTPAESSDETAKHISGSIDYPQTGILGLRDPAQVIKKKAPQRISPNDESRVDRDNRHPLWGLPTLDFGANRLRRP